MIGVVTSGARQYNEHRATLRVAPVSQSPVFMTIVAAGNHCDDVHRQSRPLSGMFALEELMTNWRQSEPKVWAWRVRARSSDGQVVTLGKYDTEAQARADQDRILKEGLYRDVTVEHVKTNVQQ